VTLHDTQIRSYGPKWHEVGERGKDHEHYKDVKRFSFELGHKNDRTLRSPAQPLGPLADRVFNERDKRRREEAIRTEVERAETAR